MGISLRIIAAGDKPMPSSALSPCTSNSH